MRLITILLKRIGLAAVALVALGQAGLAQENYEKKKRTLRPAKKTDRQIEEQDMLLVNVFGEVEFSGPNNGGLELRVSSTGEVSLYLLGSVKVAGKTPAQAEKHIRELLMKDYIRDPHVLVQVKEYRVNNVTVIGQVQKPDWLLCQASKELILLPVSHWPEASPAWPRRARLTILGMERPKRIQ